MSVNLSEAILQVFIREGITDAFGIPGAGINGFYAAMAHHRDDIHHITMRHEECCVHAASGYYRASGKLALALCTSGPGATNFVTGIYSANIDSIPIIAITGQAVRSQLGRDAFQCVDIAAIAKPIAKHTVCITNPKTAMDEVIHALYMAQEGKPGPVVIDIPLDMQKCEVDFDINAYQPITIQKPMLPVAAIKSAMCMISRAQKPLILMGGGVVLAHAEQQLLEFAETMNIPIATTYMAKGAVPYDHPLYVGTPGIQASQISGNKAMLDADTVLAIGNRFTDRHTGTISLYKGSRKFIHINIEPTEIGKIFAPDLGIVADARDAIQYLLDLAKSGKYTTTKHGASWTENYNQGSERKTDQQEIPINPHRVFGEINKAFDANTMFTTGCGITQIWSGQLQKISKARKYLVSGGAGTLGWDIPGAIGAMTAVKNANKAVCVMGDFGFTFHVQELATASTNKIPLIVIIINNAYLGLIRQNQKFAYGFEYGVSMPENQGDIDYVKVAEGFNCVAERVFSPDELAAAFERAKKSDRPYVIDVVCEPQAHCSMGNDISTIIEWNT